VLLAVTDTGIGMSSATQARIFEPFFTTKEIGHGTGLGLATVFGIVEQGGGHIYVYSEVGKGTTFKIFLPRVQAAVSPELNAARSLSRQRGSETLLVVEDEEQLRTLICSVLQEAGYTVIEAPGPNQALEALADRSRHIDLLLTDVVMPEKRGPQLAAEAVQLRPNIKVLFISGYTGGAISRIANLDPGAHFLPKPFTTAKILTKVREVLGKLPE
jgi:CheY-like chemotaxis protein